jgi:hypothetical protein
MPESTWPEGDAVAASFCAHLQAFHDGLPAEEQILLQQVFLAAASAESDQSDVQGFGIDLVPVTLDIPGQQPAVFVIRAKMNNVFPTVPSQPGGVPNGEQNTTGS